MTLLEVLVATAIGAVILVPVGMMFVTSMSTGSSVEDRFHRSGEAQRVAAAWTTDVQNVDPGGVNLTADRRCVPTTDAVGDVDLVHFTWNTATDNPKYSGGPRTAYWVTRGNGQNMKLIRKECVNNVLTERILATELARSGQSGLDVVHGPPEDPAALASPSPFCPNRDANPDNVTTPTTGTPLWSTAACTIQISGTFDYELTVTRRVPIDKDGAGQLPGIPTATVTSANTYLAVTWTPVAVAGQLPIQEYKVFWYTSPDGDPVDSVQASGSATSTTIPGLVNGQDYWVRVQAINTVGGGGLSPVVGPVQPAPTPPEQTLNVVAFAGATDGSVQDRTVTVSWQEPDNDGGMPIQSWILTFTRQDNDVTRVAVLDAAARTWTETGSGAFLANGVPYTVTVRAVNSLDGVNPDEGVESEPSGTVVPYGRPTVAADVLTRASDGSALVRWKPAGGNGRPIAGYTIFAYQGTAEPASGTVSAEAFKDATDLTCETQCEAVFASLPNGAYYRFRVQTRTQVDPATTLDADPSALSEGSSLNEEGSTEFTAPKNAPYVKPSTKPATISNDGMTAVATPGGKAELAFAAPADGGEAIDGYRVNVQSRIAGGAWIDRGLQDFVPFVSSPNVRVTLSGIDRPGEQYQFRVAAKNSPEWKTTQVRYGDFSGWSGTVVVLAPPHSPTVVTLTRPEGAASKSLSLAWVDVPPAQHGSSPVQRYRYTCLDEDGLNVVEGTRTSGQPAAVVSGFKDGKNYTCTVVAENETNASAPSAKSGTAMSFGRCELLSSADVFIKWSDPTNNFRGTEMWLEGSTTGGTGSESWSFLRFMVNESCTNLGAAMPTGSRIDKAEMSLYVWQNSGNLSTSGRTGFLASYPLTNIAGNISWNNSPSHSTMVENKLVNFSYKDVATDKWLTLQGPSLVNHVQQMFDDPTQNLGLAVVDGRNNSTGSWMKFTSSRQTNSDVAFQRPKMAITYFAP